MKKDDTRYSYDALGRLLSILGPDGDVAFTYDPFGRRISKRDKNGHSTYLYQGDAEIGLMDDSLREFRAIFGKQSSFAIELDDTPYFPLRNQRGDIVVLVEADGKAAASTRYDSFGNINGDLTSPWLFCGQRWEADLYHFDKRDYDPRLGNWISPDPAGFIDGPNLYAYVKNSPLIFVDPYGLFLTETKDFFSGMKYGILQGTTFGIHSYINGEFSSQTRYGDYGAYVGENASMLVPYVAARKMGIWGLNKVTRFALGALKTEQAVSRGAFSQRVVSKIMRSKPLMPEMNIYLNSIRGIKTNSSVKPITQNTLIKHGHRYVPKTANGTPRALPRNQFGCDIPSTDTPHTQIGWRLGRRDGYRQTREWSYNGVEVKTTDWTNHGRSDHPNPHDHFYYPNKTGGTYERGKGVPFKISEE